MPQTERDIDTGPIDGLRFLLALWVALGHFYNLVGGPRFAPLPLGGLLQSNTVAVDGFMVITGFLMTYHYCRREAAEPWRDPRTAARFLARRWIRLWPVYALVLFAAFALQGARHTEAVAVLRFYTGGEIEPWGAPRAFVPGGWTDLASHLLFLHGLVPSEVETILGPAWSLSLEMQFYAAFPLLVIWLFGGTRRGGVLFWSALAAAALALASIRLFGYYLAPGRIAHFSQPALLTYKLPLFIFGMSVAARGLGRIGGASFAAVTVILLLCSSRLTDVTALAIGAMLMLDPARRLIGDGFYRALGCVRRALSSGPARWGANVSYSVYLTHILVMPFTTAAVIAALPGLGKAISAAIALAVFLATTMALAHLLYIGVERPCIRAGKSLLRRRSAPAELAPSGA